MDRLIHLNKLYNNGSLESENGVSKIDPAQRILRFWLFIIDYFYDDILFALY